LLGWDSKGAPFRLVALCNMEDTGGGKFCDYKGSVQDALGGRR